MWEATALNSARILKSTNSCSSVETWRTQTTGSMRLNFSGFQRKFFRNADDRSDATLELLNTTADRVTEPVAEFISRREFIGGSIASLGAWPTNLSRGRIELPLAADLDGYKLVRRLAIADVAVVERLGSSHEGRPIDLISIGRGSRAALIVGAPHANEPIGCATIIRLLAHLAQDRANAPSIGLADGTSYPPLISTASL